MRLTLRTRFDRIARGFMDPKKNSPKAALIGFAAFTFVLAAAFIFVSMSLLQKIQRLENENSNLQQRSQELEKSLQTIEEKNKALLDRVEGDKRTLKTTLDGIKKENENLQLSLQKVEAELKGAKEEKGYLEEMLVNKTRELDKIKSNPPPVAAPVVAAPITVSAPTVFAPNTPAEITAKIQEKDSEIQKLAEQNRILSDKLDKLYKTMNEKITEISIAKIALEDTVANARKKLDDEMHTVNLGSISMPENKSSTSSPASLRGPKAEGKVLAVNEEQKFAVVDLGKVDNITSDTKLTVKRGDRTIASLSILEIRDVMSACHMKDVQSGEQIQVNDLVVRQTPLLKS